MKLDDLYPSQQNTLIRLWQGRRFVEIRCPECWTFHKKTCTHDEHLRGVIKKLDPKLAEELDNDQKQKK